VKEKLKMQDTMVIKQSLDKLLNENDTVFIVPHNRPDMDALGAAMGMALICKKNKKKYYIVINDELDKIEATTKKVIEEINSDFNIINLEEATELLTDKSLMVAVDVNKTELVSTKDILKRFNDIMVIDHHKTGETSIKTKYLYTSDTLSSTCEEISRLLFLYNAKISKDQANYLLAGIILDTNKLSKNVSENTYAVAAKLVSKGADASIANNMYLEDFEHDRAMQKLVDNTVFPTYIYAIACAKDGSAQVYSTEDIAKASDYLLKYQVNATFAIAYIDENTISISARSKGIIDVSKIMALFGGGGSVHSAAARVTGMSLQEIKEKLNFILLPTNLINEETMKLTLKNN
jgi:c-di-AMP phosphodiesterase-like protein